MKSVPMRILGGALGVMGIVFGITQFSQGCREMSGTKLRDEVNAMVAKGNEHVEEGNRLAAEAGERLQALFPKIDEVGFPEGREQVADEARAIGDMFQKSAEQYREAATRFDEIAAMKPSEKLEHYYTLQAKAFRKMAEVKDLARDSALLVLDEKYTTVDELVAAIEKVGEQITVADAEVNTLTAELDKFTADNPGLIE